jgi:protein SCO1/2
MSKIAKSHWLLTVAMLISLAACAPTATPIKPTPTATVGGIIVVDPPVALTDFSLPNSQLGTTTLTDLTGKFSLFTFGYTHCPDVCPINLAQFRQLDMLLDSAADNLNFVFVSVDGARDTPAVLAEHLPLFDTALLGLTGDDAAIQTLTNQFGVTYKLEKSTPDQTDYAVSHTASSFLVDPQGRILRVYSYGYDPDLVSQDIETLLQQANKVAAR